MSKYNYPSRCIHHSHKSGGTIQRTIDEFVNTEKDYHITLTAIHRALLSCKQQLCEPVSTGIVKWHMIKVGVYKRFPSYIEVNYDIEKKHLHHYYLLDDHPEINDNLLHRHKNYTLAATIYYKLCPNKKQIAGSKHAIRISSTECEFLESIIRRFYEMKEFSNTLIKRIKQFSTSDNTVNHIESHTNSSAISSHTVNIKGFINCLQEVFFNSRTQSRTSSRTQSLAQSRAQNRTSSRTRSRSGNSTGNRTRSRSGNSTGNRTSSRTGNRTRSHTGSHIRSRIDIFASLTYVMENWQRFRILLEKIATYQHPSQPSSQRSQPPVIKSMDYFRDNSEEKNKHQCLLSSGQDGQIIKIVQHFPRYGLFVTELQKLQKLQKLQMDILQQLQQFGYKLKNKINEINMSTQLQN